MRQSDFSDDYRRRKRGYFVSTLACVLVATAVSAAPATPPDLQARLDAITPDYPAPPPGVLSVAGEPEVSIRLMGVDLEHAGQPITGRDPLMDGQSPLLIKAYWCPAATITATLPLTIRFADPHNFLSREFSFRAGPVANESRWLPENIYTQTYTVDMADVAVALGGECCLTLNVQAGPRSRSGPMPLQLIRFRLEPRVRPAALSAQRLQESLQAPYRAIPFRVRLGKGARVRADVPAEWRMGNRELAVVSAVLYESVPQGQDVCEVVFVDSAGKKAVRHIVSGVTTARNDHDYFAADEINHKTPPVFESVETDYLNKEGQPFQRHTYLGRIEIPSELNDLASVEFRCSRTLILDISGLALLTR